MRDLKEISARCLPHPWILRPLEALRDRPTVGLRALDHVPIGELLLTPPLPVLRNLDHLSLVRSSVSVASNANLGEQVAGPKAGPSPRGGRIFQRRFCRPEHREPLELVSMCSHPHFRENPYRDLRPQGEVYQHRARSRLK